MRVLQEPPHPARFISLGSHKPHLASNVVGVFKIPCGRFVGRCICLESRDPALDHVAKTKADLELLQWFCASFFVEKHRIGPRFLILSSESCRRQITHSRNRSNTGVQKRRRAGE
jgi:hypothetical protein